MKFWLLFLRLVLATLFGLFTAGVLLAAAAYLYVASELPATDELRDVQFQVPLRVYTRDGLLMAEFGEKRRTPVAYESVPPLMVQAFLGAEDDRFFHHPGVDYQGLLRAAVELVRTGEKRQGGSTITMQVARNFFLSAEKSYLRKLKEIFLALRIERTLTKEEILALYLNKIYLGHRAYGVAAAAQVYYGATLDQLTLPQIAMIAGLPKAPSRDNPISNPERALVRRNYVLSRMHDLGAIDTERYQEAIRSPDEARLHAQTSEVDAAFAAEMVRAEMVTRYGNEIYTSGYQVYTTLDSRRQAAASQALRDALLDYDRRHGYRGPETHVELSEEDDETRWREYLAQYVPVGGLPAGLVIEVKDQQASVFVRDAGIITLPWDSLRWARPYVSPNHRGAAPSAAADILKPGDIVRVQNKGADAWELAQIPEVEGALVSLLPADGALQAIVGGFDFQRSKFNRAVQAERQPGSSFKPFVYSAALEKGYTAASIINDAPVVFDDPSLETTWRPENYSGKFYGPTRLREALVNSRNLVSVRIVQDIGPGFVIDHARAFGFNTDRLPRNLSLALGSGSATPLEMARGYAVFANGGYRIKPYLVERVLDADGEVLEMAQPLLACEENCPWDMPESETVTPDAGAAAMAAEAEPSQEADADMHALTQPMEQDTPDVLPAPRVLSAQNAWLMTSMMHDVIQRGTGRRARSLGRDDLSGKTGTTNDQRDAWFCGFNSALVTTAWVGFDQVHPLGAGETGSRAALPMWIAYMLKALDGVPSSVLPPPDGLVTVRIDPETGLLPAPGQDSGIFETFRVGHVPRQMAEAAEAPDSPESPDTGQTPLF